MQRIILMEELKAGDIFCFELRLEGRVAFVVFENKDGELEYQNRNTGVVSSIVISKKQKQVIYLRSI